MKRIGLILALALLAGSALAQTPTATASPTATVTPSPTPSPTITPWNFPLITQHPNGFDERPAINAGRPRTSAPRMVSSGPQAQGLRHARFKDRRFKGR